MINPIPEYKNKNKKDLFFMKKMMNWSQYNQFRDKGWKNMAKKKWNFWDKWLTSYDCGTKINQRVCENSVFFSFFFLCLRDKTFVKEAECVCFCLCYGIGYVIFWWFLRKERVWGGTKRRERKKMIE
jgi:hypothetical protein